jgi:hypothetical protein
MGAAEYLIPSTANGTSTLEESGDSVSSTVSSVTGYSVVRVVGVSSGSCTLNVEKALTSGGPFFNYSTELLDDSELDRWIKLTSGIYPYFRLTATNTESTDPIQVKFFVYFDDTYRVCTPIDIRDLTGLSTTEMEDSDIIKLIDSAVVKLNSDISEDIIEEELVYGDARRPNTIDGSNTTFYVLVGSKYHFGDLDDDGDIDTSDLVVYEYTDDNQKVLMTVSSFTTSGVDKGKFVLSTAPAQGSTLTVTYRKQPVIYSSELIKQACVNLVSAMAMSRIDPNDFSSLQIGGLKAVMGVGKKKAEKFIGKYEELVNKIDYLRNAVVKSDVGYLTIDYENIDSI